MFFLGFKGNGIHQINFVATLAAFAALVPVITTITVALKFIVVTGRNEVVITLHPQTTFTALTKVAHEQVFGAEVQPAAVVAAVRLTTADVAQPAVDLNSTAGVVAVSGNTVADVPFPFIVVADCPTHGRTPYTYSYTLSAMRVKLFSVGSRLYA